MLKPSIKVGPTYVQNIRQVCYKPDSTITFNLTYDDSQWEPLPYTITLRHRTPKQLYTTPLKIAFSKWTQLTINRQYDSFKIILLIIQNRTKKIMKNEEVQ